MTIVSSHICLFRRTIRLSQKKRLPASLAIIFLFTRWPVSGQTERETYPLDASCTFLCQIPVLPIVRPRRFAESNQSEKRVRKLLFPEQYMQLGKTFKEIRKRSKRFPEMLTSFGANVPVFSAKRSLLFSKTQVLFPEESGFGRQKATFRSSISSGWSGETKSRVSGKKDFWSFWQYYLRLLL